MTSTGTAAAVTINRNALTGFLTSPAYPDNPEGDTVERLLGLENTDPSASTMADVTEFLDSLIEFLADRQPVGVWVLAEDVEDIRIIRIYDGEDGCDGIVVTVDLVNGLRLASLTQDLGDLTRDAWPGDSTTAVVVHAMAVVADVANRIVAAYRAL